MLTSLPAVVLAAPLATLAMPAGPAPGQVLALVDEAVEETLEAVDDVAGATPGAIEETAGDVTDTVGDAADDLADTVERVITPLLPPADELPEPPDPGDALPPPLDGVLPGGDDPDPPPEAPAEDKPAAPPAKPPTTGTGKQETPIVPDAGDSAPAGVDGDGQDTPAGRADGVSLPPATRALLQEGPPPAAPPTTPTPPAPATAQPLEEEDRGGGTWWRRVGRGMTGAADALAFPLLLAAAVALFVVVQGRIDARDPKLAAAPDDYLTFPP